MTIIARMVMAPTDRSMPAVRMTRVCPIARHATTATCWNSRDCALGDANRGLRIEKTTNVSTSRKSGLSHG